MYCVLFLNYYMYSVFKRDRVSTAQVVVFLWFVFNYKIISFKKAVIVASRFPLLSIQRSHR